jgi:hypothetical protein
MPWVEDLSFAMGSGKITPVKYISPLVSNNYRWGVEIPALHTVSNKPLTLSSSDNLSLSLPSRAFERGSR